MQRALTPPIQWFGEWSLSLAHSCQAFLNAYIIGPALYLVRFTMQMVYKSLAWVLRMLWNFLCFLARSCMEILITFKMTMYNVVYRPRCSVCERGCAKLRSLCFTCVGDHLVPRCSDCGRGWCKIQSRCFSCSVDYYFPNARCDICNRGYKKIGSRCFTCTLDRI